MGKPSACLTAIFLLTLTSCSSGTQQLTIRPGYTSPGAAAAFTGRSAVFELKPTSEMVRIQGREDVIYQTIQAAVDDAPDGGVVLVPPGARHEALVLKNRNIRIRGAGMGRTVVGARETALLVEGGEVELEGLSFISGSVAPETAVVALETAQVRLTDARISGGTGPGILVSGAGHVHLEGNLIMGNMGGGVLLKGGHLQARGNTIIRNGLAGYVIAPLAATALKGLNLSHETIIDNWEGEVCQSFLRRGLVPSRALTGLVTISDSILTPGGLDESFGEDLSRNPARFRNNLLPADQEDQDAFFSDFRALDLRPKARVALVDERGLEVGAKPSAVFDRDLAAEGVKALEKDQLALAWRLSRGLEWDLRRDAETRIRDRIFAITESILSSNQVGFFLVQLLAIVDEAPDSWKLGPLLDRMTQVYKRAHPGKIQLFDFFPDVDPELRSAAEQALNEGFSGMPFFDSVAVREGEKAPEVPVWMISGSVAEPLETRVQVRSMVQELEHGNPRYQELEEGIRVYQARIAGKQQKLEEMTADLANPHKFPPGQTSRRKQLLEARAAKAGEELAGEQAVLEGMVADLGKTSDKVKATLRSELHERRLSVGLRLSVVVAPEARIIIDKTFPAAHLARWARIQPVEELGFPGLQQDGREQDPKPAFASQVAAVLMSGVLEDGLKELEEQVGRWERGQSQGWARNQLVELALAHAILFRDSISARGRYQELVKKLEERKEDSPLGIGFAADPTSSETRLRLEVTVPEPLEELTRERRTLEQRFSVLWGLEQRLDKALLDVAGLSLYELMDLRARVGKILPADAIITQ